ncbi:MAG: tol-pal system protein YbgF [Acidobacteriota bacterium]|nr:tol-pal system protein YbgF [Acidobacteriota bacterium]MDE3170225.1 tol-pal system protein YbgF [Acidobacteriota bacterium]
MRIRWVALAIAAMLCGAMGGAILAPQPADAVSREIIQLQQQVSQLMQGQQDLNTALASDTATLKTLVQQSLDSSNQLHNQMGSLQKVVQDMQANTNSTVSSMSQQQQGIADNLQDVQARVAKLSQQLNDMQGELQSIDSKVSGNAPSGGAAPNGAAPTGAAPGAAANGAPPPTGAAGPDGPGAAAPAGNAMAPISADTLYRNALRDYTGGNYDLSRQEFSDYIRNFPRNDLASNAQFYLGEIAYAQGDYKGAVAAYETVLQNYPQSFKLGASLLKKGMAEVELGMKISARRDLRDVVKRFPGSDEARRAEAKLRQIEAPSTRR